MHRLNVLSVGLIGWLMLNSSVCCQTTYTWQEETGNWSNASAWIPEGVPGVLDTAIIGSRMHVAVDSDIEVAVLIMTGGLLKGDHKLTILDSMNWQAGEIADEDTIEITPSAIMNISDDRFKSLNKRILINKGTIIWSGGGDLKLNYGARIENQSGAIFDIQNDQVMDFVLNTGGGSFTNSGTLIKSAGNGETQIDPVFFNQGIVNVNSGILRFERGDTLKSSSGTFNVTANGILEFSERLFLLDGMSINGNGIARIVDRAIIKLVNKGLLVDTLAQLVFDTDQRISDEGLFKGDGALRIDGRLIWKQGVVAGSGAFVINGLLEFSGSNIKKLVGRTLNNYGMIIWTGNGRLEMADSVVLINHSEANIEIQSYAALDFIDSSKSARFINSGILTKSNDVDNFVIDVYFSNTGTINLNVGAIILKQKSWQQGAMINLESGTQFHFDINSHFLNNIVFKGNGEIKISTDTVSCNAPGVVFDSATTLVMPSGILGGNGKIVVGGQLKWQGGQIIGTDTLICNSSLIIEGDRDKELGQKVFINAKNALWNGKGKIRMLNQALFLNQSEATFLFQSNAEINMESEGAMFFNLGQVTWQNDSSSKDIKIDFQNSGILEIKTGELQFTNIFTNNQTGKIYGAGTINFESGATFINHGVVNPGNSPGILNIIGYYAQESDGTLNIEIAGNSVGNSYDQLSVRGKAYLDGTLYVDLSNDFIPQSQDTLKILSYTSRSGEFSSIDWNRKPSEVNLLPVYDSDGLFLVAEKVNHKPHAANDSIATPEDTAVNISVLDNDSDAGKNPLTIVHFTQPANGSIIQATDSILQYQPIPNFFGLDSFRYIIDNNTGGLDTAQVQISVNSVNDLPEIVDLPDSILLKSASAHVLNLWEIVEDPETPDSLLIFEFIFSADVLNLDYFENNGELIISAKSYFTKEVWLEIAITDSDRGIIETKIQILIENLTAVDMPSHKNLPKRFAVFQNYPNPFNPHTYIHFQLPVTENVQLVIYNILGQKIHTLLKQMLPAGDYRIRWNGLNDQGYLVPGGIYIYQLETGQFQKAVKMLLSK